MLNALDLIDAAIADLEGALNLPPGGSLPTTTTTQKPDGTTPATDTTTTKSNTNTKTNNTKTNNNKTNNNNDNSNTNNDDAKKTNTKKNKNPKKPQPPKKAANVANLTQPEICKLEFKVGQITKVWIHPNADKLYCEEIECGEEKPRQISSGLRPFYTLEEMEGRRLLVVSNLKTKKLAGIPSQGMVLCAANDTNDQVEFIEPPAEAPLGEIITFTDLPPPEPFSGAQVEKKKVFQACVEGMRTTKDGEAAWEGHLFMTSKGVCRSRTIKDGAMRWWRREEEEVFWKLIVGVWNGVMDLI